MKLNNEEKVISEMALAGWEPYRGVIWDVVNELNDACAVWPEMRSAHEGISILKEEIDELWDEVKIKPKNRDLAKMRAEAIQVAAMAIRFAAECCDETTGRR